ncbi:MAG: efflux RND transporter permease subunit [Candidatus Baltobacteraceae bacterium]
MTACPFFPCAVSRSERPRRRREYRKALGTGVIGGFLSSLLLTLFVVPVVYVAYAGSRKRGRGGYMRAHRANRDGDFEITSETAVL